MAAAVHNIIVDQGSDWKINLIYKDSSGNIIPLTGYTAALQMRTSYDASSAALSLSSPSSGIVITANEGLIAVHATATQTGGLVAGDYVYDLEVTVSGEVTRLIQGIATVRPQVTR